MSVTDKTPLDDKTIVISAQTGCTSDRLKMSALVLLLILAASWPGLAFLSAFHVKSNNMNQGGVPYGIRRGSQSLKHASALFLQQYTYRVAHQVVP